MTAVAPARRGRGRPRAADPERISEIALGLMIERGYAATTMAGIARAAGVSESTVFRYFSSKASVLWYGMEDSARVFREAFAYRGARLPLVDAIFEAYLDMLHSPDVPQVVIRRRVAIVWRSTEATDAAWTQFGQWRRMVSEFVAERRGIPADSFEAEVLGGIVWSALSAAITAWATGDDPDPTSAVRAARAWVALPPP